MTWQFLSQFLPVLWWLLAAHSVADYVLQPDWMGRHKADIGKPPDAVYGPWWWSMLAHCMVNGGAVAVVTDSLALGTAEVAAHFTLDTMKSARIIDTYTDQIGHLISKGVWAACIVFWPHMP